MPQIEKLKTDKSNFIPSAMSRFDTNGFSDVNSSGGFGSNSGFGSSAADVEPYKPKCKDI